MKKNTKKEQRHEGKEDVFVQSMSAAWEKSAAVRRHILVALAAIVAIVIIVGASRQRAKAINERGMQQLAELRMQFDEEDLDPSERVEQLGALAAAIHGEARPIVLFEYAHELFQARGEENLRAAAEQCKAFLAEYPANYWTLPVRQMLGKVLFELDEYQAALAEFRTVRKAFLADERPVITPLDYEAAYYIGRCHELIGDISEARETYRQLAERINDNELWAGKAAYRLEKLGS